MGRNSKVAFKNFSAFQKAYRRERIFLEKTEFDDMFIHEDRFYLDGTTQIRITMPYIRQGEVIFLCAFVFTPEKKSADISFFVLPHYRNKGLATENIKKCFKILKSYVGQKLYYFSLSASVDFDNSPSQKICNMFIGNEKILESGVHSYLNNFSDIEYCL